MEDVLRWSMWAAVVNQIASWLLSLCSPLPTVCKTADSLTLIFQIFRFLQCGCYVASVNICKQYYCHWKLNDGRLRIICVWKKIGCNGMLKALHCWTGGTFFCFLSKETFHFYKFLIFLKLLIYLDHYAICFMLR